MFFKLFISEAKSTPSSNFAIKQKLLREIRDVTIKTAMETELNSDQEDENLAIEEVHFIAPTKFF